MIKRIAFLLLLGARVACASSYYVDCNYGSNGNAGTSLQTAWRTPLAVTLHSANPGFAAGDAIYFKRDCTWYEGVSLTSSGQSGNPITVDSFNLDGSTPGATNSGRPPHLTGYLPIADAFWSDYSGNVWVSKPLFDDNGSGSDNCANDGGNCVACPTRGILYSCLSQPLGAIGYVRFGTVWGNAAASVAGIKQDRDWYFDPNTQLLYVYCSVCGGGVKPPDFYGQVTPIVSPTTMLNLNGVQYLVAQHLLIDWFAGYGVQVQGASDHLWLANMAANSMVENGAVPLGFYVQPSGAPTDIHLYNTDANMNYAGYEFAGCATGGCSFEIKNCRAYGNRAYGIVDDAGGAVSYDYCHLYANNLATALTVDTSGTPGPAAGTHNIAAETPPWIREWRRWPAYTTVTYDDPGLVQYSDTYVNGLLPMMAVKQVPLSIAVVTDGTYSQPIIGEVQRWINAGWDINTHSVSHQYWQPPASACSDTAGPVPCDAFTIQYVGSIATSVTLSITHSGAGGTLSINSSPFDGCAYVSGWDLTPGPVAGGTNSTSTDTVGKIISALLSKGSCWSINQAAYNNAFMKGNAHSVGLANVTNQDVKTSPYAVMLNESYLENDEMSWAQGWMNLNLTGLPTKRVYVMPGSYEDATTEAIAAGLGYVGVRGTGSLKPCCGANTTLATGYDVFNILSQGAVPSYQSLSYKQLRNRVSQDLFKNRLWGRPIGYFWHVNELRPDEVENFMDGLAQGGAALESNTQMVELLLGCAVNDQVPAGYVAGSYYACPSSGVEADFRPTANSPVPNPPLNLGVAYQYDLMGINRNLFGAGWEMGAYAYVGEAVP